MADQDSHRVRTLRGHVKASGSGREAGASRWGWSCLRHPHVAATESCYLLGQKVFQEVTECYVFPKNNSDRGSFLVNRDNSSTLLLSAALLAP